MEQRDSTKFFILNLYYQSVLFGGVGGGDGGDDGFRSVFNEFHSPFFCYR